MEQNILKLKNELLQARREIANLRSKVISLQYIHKKEIEDVKNRIKNIKCSSCKNLQNAELQASESQGMKNSIKTVKESTKSNDIFTIKPIGYVKTDFTEKRAVPRQAIIGDSILSHIELSKNVFSSNPEQSLEGLEDFSHIWVFFIFHKNLSFNKPKVSPPRLNRKNVGVLSTRSPHRPNSIGISLVKIDKIDGTRIYFYGTDMIAKTPVIDIKPYIPDYDAPEDLEKVKIPHWIKSSKNFKIIFSENSLKSIENYKMNLKSLEELLSHDPRSVYVREKYQSQEFIFNFNGKSIHCLFDDENKSVNIVEIKIKEE